ncbi:hypothetical protein [Tunturiibacter lichenicola]|uniref:hypothetical protein n=1 Tax=Tunturiibacter lichenicola TaxID=2051959 RepID=UPI003D9B19F1
MRKVFGPQPEDRREAINWPEDARSLKRKEGAEALPVSAKKPLLTMEEKKAIRADRDTSVTLGELCDDLKVCIAEHPTQYRDQVNPPRRLDRIKAGLGDKPASSLKPREAEAWLDGLTNSHAQGGKGRPLSDASVNRYRVMLSAAYKRGIRDEMVTDNPVKGTSQRKPKNGVIRWLQPDEEKAIRGVIQRRIDWCEEQGRPQEANWERQHLCEFVISLQTGMRGENSSGLRIQEWT